MVFDTAGAFNSTETDPTPSKDNPPKVPLINHGYVERQKFFATMETVAVVEEEQNE